MCFFFFVGDIDNFVGVDGDFFVWVIQCQYMQYIVLVVGSGYCCVVWQGQCSGGDCLLGGIVWCQVQILGGKFYFFIVVIVGEMIDDQFYKVFRQVCLMLLDSVLIFVSSLLRVVCRFVCVRLLWVLKCRLMLS